MLFTIGNELRFETGYKKLWLILIYLNILSFQQILKWRYKHITCRWRKNFFEKIYRVWISIRLIKINKFFDIPCWASYIWFVFEFIYIRIFKYFNINKFKDKSKYSSCNSISVVYWCFLKIWLACPEYQVKLTIQPILWSITPLTLNYIFLISQVTI